MTERVKFGIDLEVLSKIVKFVGNVSDIVAMGFWKDRMIVAATDCYCTQYAEVEIRSTGMIDYTLRYCDMFVGIVIDTGGVVLNELREIANLASCDTHNPERKVVINVKLLEDKIEFHCPGNVVIYANVGDDYGVLAFRAITQLTERIHAVRKDNSVKVSSVKVDQNIFKTVCISDVHIRDARFCDGPEGIHGSLMETVEMMIDENGLVLLPKSGHGLYELKIRLPNCTDINPQKIDDVVGDDSKYISSKIRVEQIFPMAYVDGVSPITVEIRKDRPIVLEQKISDGITAMLSVTQLATDVTGGE